MRVIPTRMRDILASGVFTGSARPIGRVTLQQTSFMFLNYGKHRFASLYFDNPRDVFELPNVYQINWTRDVNQDAGTCEMLLYNTRQLPIGTRPTDGDYNQPGYYTFNRGSETNRWGHTANQWRNRLYPDMLVKTYEGYGYDPTVSPEQDSNMMPSGVWLIDTVKLTALGLITVTMRDGSRSLMDHICFPPVITSALYPLSYQHKHQVANPKKPVTASGSGFAWHRPTYYDDSGHPYIGKNGNIGGHHPKDAFDNDPTSYWLSIGNASPKAGYSFEWIEGSIATGKVAAVEVVVKGGPYRVYVSLHDASTGWKGKSRIPYDPNNPVSFPNGSDIPFVKSSVVEADSTTTIDVTDTANIDRVRVTFTDLWDSNYGTNQFRAAVKTFNVLVNTGAGATKWVSGGTHTVGNYDDYTDIVKWLLCYGGFLWPKNIGGHSAYQMETGPPSGVWGDLFKHRPSHIVAHPVGSHADPVVGGSAVWGDIENSGTFGPSDLTTDIFDKKPLMDGIIYVRDIVGFIFYVDETGGAQFRSPNIWSVGNWVRQPDHRYVSNATRDDNPDHMLVIDEESNLNSLEVTLDSKDVRERIVIANVSGNKGAVTKGFKPYAVPDTGFRRVSIYSDQHFASNKECQIMADLVAIRQLFRFRTDIFTMPGDPRLQVDDQVKVVERVTSENFDIHYVQSISSSLNMSEGTWTYSVGTHWLGNDPFGNWVFDPANLDPATQTYLHDLGKLA